jgi:hypothetical protein
LGGIASNQQSKSNASFIRKSGEFNAEQYERQAGEARASSEREAEDERLKAERLGSRGLAVAAASGGGVDNPTILDILSNIESQGEYLAQGKMYSGKERSAGLLDQAAATRYNSEVSARATRAKGKAALIGSIFEGVGDIGKAGVSYASNTGGSSTSDMPDISGDPADGWKIPKRSYG